MSEALYDKMVQFLNKEQPDYFSMVSTLAQVAGNSTLGLVDEAIKFAEDSAQRLATEISVAMIKEQSKELIRLILETLDRYRKEKGNLPPAVDFLAVSEVLAFMGNAYENESAKLTLTSDLGGSVNDTASDD